jgi:plastocyanin
MLRLGLLLVLVAGLAAACGGDTTDGDAGAGGSLEIVLTDFAVEPPAGSLEPDTYTARVTNEGGVVHALKVDGPTGETESAQLQPGQSVELEIDLSEAGEYELTCPVGDHRGRGMEAALAVGGGMGATTTDETTTDETTTEDDEGGYRY